MRLLDQVICFDVSSDRVSMHGVPGMMDKSGGAILIVPAPSFLSSVMGSPPVWAETIDWFGLSWQGTRLDK